MAQEDVSTARLEAFSDGVIAIIVTIMVLEIKAPAEPTVAALLAIWPTFFAYALSFLIVAIYWVNHRHVIRYATDVTPALLWVNMLVLFTTSLIPVATAWLGEHLTETVPNVVYGLVLIAGGISFLGLQEIVNRQNVSKTELALVIRVARIKAAVTLGLYALGVDLAPFLPGTVLAAAAIGAALYFVPMKTEA